ncbi:biogenesis of lysosome-related organelles complex 1 subunit 4 [Lepus europaeus]|uniref:biogenesis of lysosome-related organelles complex 1 subunit 4 n=1 Tax=Lepus europaeus TaxID=9983 RepID=UPI002B46BF29|nr:biogenesis of lysosome-related organelles complex 1 subunit 4 [Lepus europaeus]
MAEPPAAEEAEAQGPGWGGGDSGHVSQSHSSASGPWEDEGPEDGAPGRDPPLLRRAAAGYAACLLPAARPEVQALDASLEDLLARVDEFVAMLDLIRGDSAHVVREGVPRVHAQAAEMRRVYGKIDRLEAFVRMVGSRVARTEQEVARAEAELGALPRALRRLLRSVGGPGRLARPPPPPPPGLFRAEDHFPRRRFGPGPEDRADAAFPRPREQPTGPALRDPPAGASSSGEPDSAEEPRGPMAAL